MVATINASVSSSGIVSTADGSGILKVQSNGVTTNALAWVNFNGVTTATVRASYNVSSVTRNATGDYTVNFTNTLSDANYSCIATSNSGGDSTYNRIVSVINVPSTSSVRLICSYTSNVAFDVYALYLAIFGN